MKIIYFFLQLKYIHYPIVMNKNGKRRKIKRTKKGKRINQKQKKRREKGK